MPVKTLCMIAFDVAEAKWLIEKTCDLALALDAHVLGVHPFSPAIFYGGIDTAPMVFASLAEWEAKEAEVVRALFERRMKANGLQYEFRSQDTLAASEDFLLLAARAADLVVMGTNASRTRMPNDIALTERIIRNLGRPVLVLGAEGGLVVPAKSIAIGWSETREATRAAHDALMIAAPKARIELISLLAHTGGEPPGLSSRELFAMALDRQGYIVRTHDRIAHRGQVAQALVTAAQELDAELIAAGAFGHSQLYDVFVGAMTRDLMKSAGFPVLLSR